MAKRGKEQEVELTKLKPYAKNAKIHSPAQVQKIADSIQEFGFLNACLIDKDYNIIAGHGRVEAAKLLGMEKVPCVFIEGLTEEQRKAYILADNRLTELGEWDMDLVTEELEELEGKGFNTSLIGFDWDAVTELEPIEEEATAEDILSAIDTRAPETRVKRGDLYQLGRHRLMCGDSTNEADMALLFDNRKADMVFTDPPYGVAIGTKNKTIMEVKGEVFNSITEDIEGDTMDVGELYEMLVKAMSQLRNNCADHCSYYVSAPQGGAVGKMMLQMMQDAGLEVRHTLIWVKSSTSFSFGRLDYDYKHEPIFYTWTKNHRFYGGYDATVIDDNQKLEDLSKEELKELVHALKKDGSTTAIYCDKPQRCDLHPTMKPLKLIQRFVYNNSKEGDTVADIFGGSGSTMIVCEKMNRNCLMMELDPHYCDVIIERWEEFTGEKAERIN